MYYQWWQSSTLILSDVRWEADRFSAWGSRHGTRLLKTLREIVESWFISIVVVSYVVYCTAQLFVCFEEDEARRGWCYASRTRSLSTSAKEGLFKQVNHTAYGLQKWMSELLKEELNTIKIISELKKVQQSPRRVIWRSHAPSSGIRFVYFGMWNQQQGSIGHDHLQKAN